MTLGWVVFFGGFFFFCTFWQPFGEFLLTLGLKRMFYGFVYRSGMGYEMKNYLFITLWKMKNY